jgi:hypothetical protein
MTEGAYQGNIVLEDMGDCIDLHLELSPFGAIGLSSNDPSNSYSEECRSFTDGKGNYKLTLDGSIRHMGIEIDGDDGIEGSAEYEIRCIGEKDGTCRAYELGSSSCEGYEGEGDIDCDVLTGAVESIVEDYNNFIRPNHQGNIVVGALIALLGAVLLRKIWNRGK